MSSESPSELDREVRELRRSSRLLVRVLGVMAGRVDGLGCTPAQCHALLELGSRGRMTTGELAEVLEIDKSTASRTVQPLLKDGLVLAESDPHDQRTKPMRLSERGRLRMQEIHAAADTQVRGALELLCEEDRRKVLQGVSLYEQALHRARALSGVTIRPVEVDDEPQLANLLRSVLSEFGAVGCGTSSEDDEIDRMHAAYAREGHAYFVAEREGRLLAGAGIAPLQGAEEPGMCELRKMHALPAARGLGIGRLLLDRALAGARAAGYARCYLETLRHMHRARALYEKLGFRRLDAPLGRTGHFACDDWYLLELSAGDSPTPTTAPSQRTRTP